jgi:tight adherence protein B
MASILKDQSTAAGRVDFSGILRDDERFGTGKADDAADQLNTWFDDLMLHAGLGISPSMMVAISLCSAVTFGGLAFVLQENLLTTALGTLVGFLIPVVFAMIARSRRQSTLMQQLPPMLEELSRAAKTGRSIDQCLIMVANDTPAPLGDELRLGAGRLTLGVPVKDAFRDLPSRTGLMTLNLLVMSLAIHQQTGGDLVRVLERLSRTIRDRLSYLGRLRAATAASRATATLMVVLPPAVLLFFTFRDPAYFTNLFSSQWGRNATLLAVALEIVGAFWVFKILRDSQRT